MREQKSLLDRTQAVHLEVDAIQIKNLFWSCDYKQPTLTQAALTLVMTLVEKVDKW